MKAWLVTATLMLALALSLPAAISIQSVETLLTFDTLPSSNNWRAVSIGFDSGSPVITTAAQMDEQVQIRSAASISNVLQTQTVGTPSSFNYARWNAAGGFIQSRMGNNWCAVFVARLRNDTPMPLQWLDISYDVTTGPCPCAAEEVPGFRVYFSLTGEANSWLVMPALSTGATGHVNAVINLGGIGLWLPGTEAYLLWADDNSSGTDAYYTLDNLKVALAPRLTIQPQPGGNVELSWPDGRNHYWVETASHLQSTSWQTLLEPTNVSGGRIRVSTVTTNTTFFRLAAPGI
jgi:hypothetical protein